MNDFTFKVTDKYVDACIMEKIKKGEAIYSQVENGKSDISDIEYPDLSLVMIYLAYELGLRKMYEFINTPNSGKHN